MRFYAEYQDAFLGTSNRLTFESFPPPDDLLNLLVVTARTYGPFELQASYKQSFDGTTLTKDVDIGFVFGPGFSDVQKSTFRTAAVTNIESIWNNRLLVFEWYFGGYRDLR